MAVSLFYFWYLRPAPGVYWDCEGQAPVTNLIGGTSLCAVTTGIAAAAAAVAAAPPPRTTGITIPCSPTSPSPWSPGMAPACRCISPSPLSCGATPRRRTTTAPAAAAAAAEPRAAPSGAVTYPQSPLRPPAAGDFLIQIRSFSRPRLNLTPVVSKKSLDKSAPPAKICLNYFI